MKMSNDLSKRRPRRSTLLTIAATLAVVLGGGAYFFGTTAYAAVITILASGNLPYSEVIGGPATVTFRTISFAPGEVGAWHYHPGPLFNVVTQGTVTLEDGCGGEQSYGPGQGFEESGRVHRPKNLGSEATFAYQSFVVPQGVPTTNNIPGNEQVCGPPRDVDECKSRWMDFTFPTSFQNQGQCISFINGSR